MNFLFTFSLYSIDLLAPLFLSFILSLLISIYSLYFSLYAPPALAFFAYLTFLRARALAAVYCPIGLSVRSLLFFSFDRSAAMPLLPPLVFGFLNKYGAWLTIVPSTILRCFLNNLRSIKLKGQVYYQSSFFKS